MCGRRELRRARSCLDRIEQEAYDLVVQRLSEPGRVDQRGTSTGSVMRGCTRRGAQVRRLVHRRGPPTSLIVRRPRRMKAIRILVLTACVLVTHSLHAQTQEGWSDPSIAVATEDCTQFIVAPLKKEFARRAEISGDTRATFPEKEVRESFEPLCGCIVHRAAATWPLAEWQANFEAHFASMFQEAMAGGQCKPLVGPLGEVPKHWEGGTYRPMQEDFDRIRLDHAFVIGALLDEYRAKVGTFPFAEGTDSIPTVVIIGTADQERRNSEFIRIRVDLDLRATNGVPAPSFPRVAFHTMNELQEELGRVLGHTVQVPVDPQKFPVNKPSIYTYVLYQGTYDVSVFLHQKSSFARPLGPYHNKVAIASRSYPRGGFWTAADLKKEPQFIEFFQKPFIRDGYTLKTRL